MWVVACMCEIGCVCAIACVMCVPVCVSVCKGGQS